MIRAPRPCLPSRPASHAWDRELTPTVFPQVITVSVMKCTDAWSVTWTEAWFSCNEWTKAWNVMWSMECDVDQGMEYNVDWGVECDTGWGMATVGFGLAQDGLGR